MHKSMFPLKNGIKSANIMSTGLHKSFPVHCMLRGKFLKLILTYLYYTNNKEINTCHLVVQNHIFCKKWYNYFVYRLVQKNSNILLSTF